MTGIVAVMTCTSGLSVLPGSLALGSSNGESGLGVNASGRISFNNDGTISYQGVNTEVGGLGPTQWATSTGAGKGDNIYIRATVTSGTLTTNPATVFTLLSSNRQFIKGPTTSDTSCTVTFDFSYDGTNVALSSPGWTLQTSHV